MNYYTKPHDAIHSNTNRKKMNQRSLHSTEFSLTIMEKAAAIASSLSPATDYSYDWYDELEDTALTRLRDADAMSEEDTEGEEEGNLNHQSSDFTVQAIGRLSSP